MKWRVLRMRTDKLSPLHSLLCLPLTATHDAWMGDLMRVDSSVNQI